MLLHLLLDRLLRLQLLLVRKVLSPARLGLLIHAMRRLSRLNSCKPVW